MSSDRILIWTASYPPVLGGLQRVVSQLAEACAEKGYEVLVIANRFPLGLAGKEVIHPNLKVLRFLHWDPNRTGWKKYLHLIGYYRLSMQLQHTVRQFKPQRVWVHFPVPQIPYLHKVYRASGTNRWSLSFHGHDVLRYMEQGEDFSFSQRASDPSASLLKFIDENKPGMSACSDWLSKKVEAVFSEPCTHIHNAVDLSKLKELKSDIPHKKPYLFAFGRLDEHKGFQLLIIAYLQVLQEKGDFPDLVIAGEGIYRRELENLIPEDCRKKILLPGKMTLEELYSWGKHADSIWIPSLREPFGIVALEALAMNDRVFASRVGGLPEAGGQHLIYFDPRVKEVLHAIELSLNFESSTGRTPSKQTYLESFSVERMCEKYLTL